ncbi:DUF4268 domain-containing protein [Bacillus sp. AK031]
METVLGNLQVIDAREVWKHEERDFTPWLAQNVEAISQVIGIPIEIEQTEKRVGNYKLDILGKVENTDKVVVIENQLEESDHKHLGQLITYASGLDAAIIIWVTPSVREEHRSAIEWLNDITGEEVSFFLLKPEVIRIDASRPAVRFHLESGPSEFIRDIKEVVKNEEAPRHIFRKDFWKELLDYFERQGDTSLKNRRPNKDSWLPFSVGKSGVVVNACLAQNSKLRIELYLQHSSLEINNENFNTLRENQHEIESLFNIEDVIFDSMDGSKASRIKIERDYDVNRSKEDKDYRETDLFPWIYQNVELLRSIGKRYLLS